MDEYYNQKAKYAYGLFTAGKPFRKVYAAVEKDGEFIVLEHESGKYKYSLSVINSDTYQRVLNDNTRLYYQSPRYVYSFLDNELKTGKI